MEQIALILKAYRWLDQITPLQTDCGTLCDKACCLSTEDVATENFTQNSGMYLFPGEVSIQSAAAYVSLHPVNIATTHGAYRSVLAVCNGSCPRHLRPLACRIFPLTPYVDPDGEWLLRMDLRGRSLCPLVRQMQPDELEPDFIAAVWTVINLLATDPEIRYFMTLLSRIQDETAALFTRFGIQSSTQG
ncbi:MAG TPA: hypothetical protein VF531_13200 [Bacillota bacterium]